MITYILQFELFPVNINEITWWYHTTTSHFYKIFRKVLSLLQVFSLLEQFSVVELCPKAQFKSILFKRYSYILLVITDLRILRSWLCWLSLLRFLSFHFKLQQHKATGHLLGETCTSLYCISAYAPMGMFASKYLITENVLSSFKYQIRYYLF